VFYASALNGGVNGIDDTAAISGRSYNLSGGRCGSSGTNGTYTGRSVLHGPAGVTISWDKKCVERADGDSQAGATGAGLLSGRVPT
jgi:hypothetical protein